MPNKIIVSYQKDHDQTKRETCVRCLKKTNFCFMVQVPTEPNLIFVKICSGCKMYLKIHEVVMIASFGIPKYVSLNDNAKQRFEDWSGQRFTFQEAWDSGKSETF